MFSIEIYGILIPKLMKFVTSRCHFPLLNVISFDILITNYVIVCLHGSTLSLYCHIIGFTNNYSNIMTKLHLCITPFCPLI